MCCPTWPNLILLFYPVISLVRTRRAWKFKQESHAQLSLLVNWCSLVPCPYLGPPLLALNLVTTFACYPSFAWCLLLCNQICATWEFLWVVCSIIVPRLAIYGAMTKPRAPMGAHTRLCCSAHASIEVSSHDPLPNCTDVLFSRELFLG